MSELDVRKLAAQRGDPWITTFYLDVDGRRFPRPTDVEAKIAHLFRQARAEAQQAGDGEAAAVEADVGAIEAWLAGGLDRRHTRGLAAFSCARRGFFLGVAFPEPVADGVALDEVAHLGPLLEAQAASRPCLVVLVDRERSRFIEVEGGEATERPGPVDGTVRRVDTDVELGGFARLREEALRRHLRLVADAVDEARAARPYAWLLLGGPEAAGLSAELRRAGAPSVVGEVAAAMTAPAHEVVALAACRRDELERRRREGLVHALLERVGGDACLGLEATLGAIADGRAAKVMVAPHAALGGWRCRACGGLTGTGGAGVACSRCGGDLAAVADLLEAAIADALRDGAEVEVVAADELAAEGGIGAFLRFRRPGGTEGGGDLDA